VSACDNGLIRACIGDWCGIGRRRRFADVAAAIEPQDGSEQEHDNRTSVTDSFETVSHACSFPNSTGIKW
jgi:hypothetical protein